MPNILVVDDERAIRESLSILLSEQGHKVDSAPGVEEALALLIRNPYDLVLTDLLMPKIDGFELIKTIRGKWGSLPVIILTAHGTTDIASLAINQGISDFILKPFEIKTVTDAVQYALLKQSETAKNQEKLKHQEQNSEFEKKFFGLSMLDTIGRTVALTTEIDEVGEALMSMVQPLLQPSRALLAVYHRENQGIRFQQSFPLEKNGESKLKPEDKIVLEWITKSSQCLRIDDVAHDPRFRACLAGIYSSGSLLAAPMLRKSSVLGGILLYRQPGFGFFQPVDQQLLSVLASMASVAFENAALYDELKNYFTGTIRALISTVETKDPIHYGHSARVARYALMIGKHLHLSELELRRLEYLSLLHDIGKIGVPERVLRQKPELTGEEREILNTHVLLGENIVRSIHFLPGGDKIVRWHHERFDGRGFPDGLSGEAIPMFSRIIAVADAFDNGVGMDNLHDIGQQTKTMEVLKQGAGSRFDTALVNLFLKAYQELNA